MLAHAAVGCLQDEISALRVPLADGLRDSRGWAGQATQPGRGGEANTQRTATEQQRGEDGAHHIFHPLFYPVSSFAVSP